MAVEAEESHQCRPRLFVAGKGPGYAGKNLGQQLAQEWLSGCVFFLVQSAAVEEPGNQSQHKQQNCKTRHMTSSNQRLGVRSAAPVIIIVCC